MKRVESQTQIYSNKKKNMPLPTSVATLQAFLGLMNYYSNFIPKNACIKSSTKSIT